MYTSIDYTPDYGITKDEVVDLENQNQDDLEQWLDYDADTAIYNLLTNDEDEF